MALEVLRETVVEELPELLHLVLLLVGHREPRLVQHVLGADDLGAGAQREGDGVRRAGADLDAGAEDQRPRRTRRRFISVIRTSVSSLPVAVRTSFIRSCVSGRGGTTPCCAKAIAVASTAPIQIGR